MAARPAYEDRLFVMRLLTMADEQPGEPQEAQRIFARMSRFGPNAWYEPMAHEPYGLDETVGIIWATRRLRHRDIEADDDFWRHHSDTWLASARQCLDTGLRSWVQETDEAAAYQAAAFEAFLHPCWLRQPTADTIGGMAFR